MSNPRVKRPFAGASSDPTQRQITSFFNVQPSGGAPRAEDVRSPLLPASVQANLLSVGMRVRKSVPEGYKVNDTSAFKLWTDSTVPSSTPRTSIVRSAPRELLPFCGINRIGGLGTQPEVVEREDDFDAVPDLEDVPGLTMSQESADSAVESSHNRKRIFVDDVDDAPNPVRRWIFDADEGVSPRSLMPTGWGNARPIAIPRSRAAKKNTAAAVKDDVGQENMLVDEDFEEASFLVYGDGMDTTG